MSERRFDILLTLVLMGFGVWYGWRMHSYPAGAGMVPVTVAAVFVGALAVQALLMLRRTAPAEAEPTEAEAGSSAATLSASAAAEQSPPRAANEPEMDTYETLIALQGPRRRRLFMIVAFAVAFYAGTMLVSFVITSGVLLTAILLISREKLYVALLGGLTGAGAAYGVIVGLLGQPPFEGYLIG